MQRLPTIDTKIQPNSEHTDHQITLTLFIHKYLPCKTTYSPTSFNN